MGVTVLGAPGAPSAAPCPVVAVTAITVDADLEVSTPSGACDTHQLQVKPKDMRHAEPFHTDSSIKHKKAKIFETHLNHAMLDNIDIG